MSVAANVDLVADQGADFGIQVYWTDPTNKGYTVLSPMRGDIQDAVGTTVYTWVTNDNATDDSPPNVLYNSSTGLIQLTMSADDTNSLTPGDYVYDFFITYQDNAVTGATRTHRLLYGKFTVQGKVTQNG